MPARDWATPSARRAGGARPRALRELARRVRGPVIRPGAARYAAAARVYNARFDGARPDAVVEPRRLARRAGDPALGRPPRRPRHRALGRPLLRRLLDARRGRRRRPAAPRRDRRRPRRRRASVGAGAHAIAIVDSLARHGGAVPLGSCPTVGLGGLALGGGYGLAARAWGLTADNVTAHHRRHARRPAAARRSPPRRGPVLGAARRRRRQLRRSPRASSCACTARHAPPGSAARCRTAPTRSRRGRRGRRRPTRALTSLLQLGSNGSVDVLGQYLGSEAQLDANLGPLRRAGASLTTGTSAYGPLQVRWANGRTSPRTTFSAKSHYVTRALPRAPARRCSPSSRAAAAASSSTPTAAR